MKTYIHASMLLALLTATGCAAEVDTETAPDEVVTEVVKSPVNANYMDPRVDPASSCRHGGGAYHMEGQTIKTVTTTSTNGGTTYKVCSTTYYSCEGGSNNGLEWSSSGCVAM